MKRATYFLLAVAFIIAGTGNAFPRQSIGIIWENPGLTEAEAQLDLFEEIGVQVIEIPSPVSTELLQILEERPFSIWIKTGHEFITISELQTSRTQLLSDFIQKTDDLSSFLKVEAVSLLQNSEVRNENFMQVFNPLLDSLYASSNKEFYFIEGEQRYFFHRPNLPFAKSFDFDGFNPQQLHQLNEWMTDDNSSEVILLSTDWIETALDSYPELHRTFINYRSDNVWLLPLPEYSEVDFSANVPVLILLILWLSLALLLKLNPVSRAMIMRYLLSHRFYADDIVNYRERSAAAGFTLLVQHIVFSGLTFWILSKIIFSETGVDAFFHHLPSFALAGRNYTSFFFIGMIISFLISFISLIWLHFSSKILKHFSQTINLYSGIFFLDFIIVTTMLTLYLAGTGNALILMLGLLFLLCRIIAFYIVTIDVSKAMITGNRFYLAIAAGTFTVFLLFVAFAIYNSTFLMEPIRLANTL